MNIFTGIIESRPGLIDSLAPDVSGIHAAYTRPHKLIDLLTLLKGEGYVMLKDMNAVDMLGMKDIPGDAENRFFVYYLLYAPAAKQHCIVKVMLNDREDIPSVSGLWCGANWQERQIFDMFGIVFSDHPALTRIIMMNGFEGHPLRKDFPITGGNGLALIKDILLPDPVDPGR
ncbi:MAG: NADH-quinone oxidoreductase subunit C [Spirochaetota bacterium]